MNDLSDQDKLDIAAAAVLIWRHGVHTPDDAAVAFNFTRLAQRLAPKPPVPEEKK